MTEYFLTKTIVLTKSNNVLQDVCNTQTGNDRPVVPLLLWTLLSVLAKMVVTMVTSGCSYPYFIISLG